MSAQNWFGTGPIAFGIRKFRESDREAVLGLWESEFGLDRDTGHDWLDAAQDSDVWTRCYVASPSNDGRMLGFGIITVIDEDGAEWAADYFDVDELTPEDFEKPTGVLHMCAVRPEVRQQGIATALWKQRLAYARSLGAEQILGVSWLRDDAPDSSVLFEKFGFETVVEAPLYYPDERDDCPDCSGPCECTARIYRREYE